MAPTRDKWVRRFIIPETTRHKKGFTIYKVTSVVFLKSSHEEISKVSVWKRYNDFKKLHSELNALCSKSQIKESFPSFPKPRFFGRFEAEVIEERRECALKFLEFVGRHSYLYSSDIFIKFFETSHADYCLNDCSQSVSSDTSAEDDRHACINTLPANDAVLQSILQPKSIQTSLTNSRSVLSISTPRSKRKQAREGGNSKELQSVWSNDADNKIECEKSFATNDATDRLLAKDTTSEKIISNLEDNQLICNKNNNCYEDSNRNVNNKEDSMLVQTSNSNTRTSIEDLNFSVSAHDGSDLPQSCTDSSQYILIAAAHMSAAFRHEDLTEYEEAFTQYKMGISSLRSGIESDCNKIRAEIIKEKITKYLERAEKLYNRYLNCNISLLNKPISELQHYKLLKIIESVMLVKDIRKDCLNIVKAIEKFSTNKENISNYILRGQVPHMVQLHACIETETTVFLILQHLSRGKLWDFVTSHYKSSSRETCDNIILENGTANDRTVNDNDIILKSNGIKNEFEGTKVSMEDLNLISTNSKVQMEMHSVPVDENYEKYSDVSTTQLLEKAQILLQSVNATLQESNSVVNRLRDSDHLMNHEDSTTLLNLKNSVHRSTNWNEVTVDINEISLGFDDINRNTTMEKIPEKNVILSNYFSLNDVKNTKSQCSTDNSSLNDSSRDLSFDEKGSTNSSIDNLKSVDTHFAMDRDNKTLCATHNCEFNTSTETDSKIETNRCYALDDQPIQYMYTADLESIKNNNIDVDEELWTIPENVIRLWAAEILLALEALHQQEVIIFDLKPSNILLDDNGHVQLTYIIPNHDIDLMKYKHPYSSPELCMFSPVIPLTSAADIWSYGVILYELIAGNRFQVKHPSVFQSHSIINIPNKLSENAKSLLVNILKYQPDERMTIPQIKQHPFFKDINWANLASTI